LHLEPIQQAVFFVFDASGDLFHHTNRFNKDQEIQEERVRIELKIRERYPNVDDLVQDWKDVKARELLVVVAQSSLTSLIIDKDCPTSTLGLAMVVHY
jgi:hypothetical protein